MTGRNQKSRNLLKGFESTKERENAWVNYYSQLLYNSDVIHTSNINVPNPLLICTDHFSCEEYEETLKQLQDTSSLDGIPTSFFKSDNVLSHFGDISTMLEIHRELHIMK